jgi:hypothetical protein
VSGAQGRVSGGPWRVSGRPAARQLRWLALGAAAITALARAPRARAQPVDPTELAEPPPPPTAVPAEVVLTPPPADPAVPAPTEPTMDDPPRRSLADLVDVFDDQNRVPANPALDVLDASGLTAVKPGSLRDLSTELRALYKNGKVVPQLAIELAPYVVAFGQRSSYDDYRRHAYVPLLHRFSISLATTSIDEGGGTATLGALGVRVRLLDRSDWRLDREAVTCALSAVEIAKPPSKPGTAVVVPVEDEAAKQEAKKVQACFDKASRRTGTWNAEQVALGAAVSSAFPGGKLEADIRDLTAWAAWGHHLTRKSLLVIAGKYLFSDTRKDGDGRIPARHSASLAGELERRSDRFGLVGSLGLGRRWSEDTAAMAWVGEWVAQLGVGLGVRISGGTWVELQASAQLVEGEDDALISLANFKWGFDVKPSKTK